MCDGTMTLIQSFIQSFFKENLQTYLDRCFLIASGQYIVAGMFACNLEQFLKSTD